MQNIQRIPYRAVQIAKRVLLRDLQNLIRYGWSAPKFAETIWIKSQDCNKVLNLTDGWQREDSAKVIKSSWPTDNIFPVTDMPKFKFCLEHWVNGVAWENTGAYEYMEKLIKREGKGADLCKNMNDIKRRYQKLDLIFTQTKKMGRLKSMKEIKLCSFRESGGVFVHVGPNGEPFFGMGGIHRFAIAHILKTQLPAQIGCVHVSAISHLDNLRKKIK